MLYILGNTSDYRKNVQIKFIVSSKDFYQPIEEENAEEDDFIYQTVDLMVCF